MTRIVIGLVLGFLIGAGCRRFDVPVPAPPRLYSWEEIYGHGDNMAPGGLYLAALVERPFCGDRQRVSHRQ